MHENERMKVESLAKTSVLTQPLYEPGKPIETVARELGLDPSGIFKLASNENPFGPSPKAIEAAKRALTRAALYPDGGCHDLRHALAANYGLDANQFVVGNGSNELIELLGHVFLGPGDEVVMGSQAFVVYKLVALLFGAKPVEVPLRNWTHDLDAMASAVTSRTKLVCVCSPNNPTGTANSEADLVAFIRKLPKHVVVVIDEAYAEYLAAPPDLRPLIREGHNLICLRTFSKIFGLASLRVGFGYGGTELCGLLNRVRQPFNVSAIGQAAALAALEDAGFAARCRELNRAGLNWLSSALAELNIEFVPSVANFLLVNVGDGSACFRYLQSRGVVVRPVGSYGLPAWVRITVGTSEQNEKVIACLRDFLSGTNTPTKG